MKVATKGLLIVFTLAVASLGLKGKVEKPMSQSKYNHRIIQGIRGALTDQNFVILAQTDPLTVTAYKDGCMLSIGPSQTEGGGDSAFRATYGQLGVISFWYLGKLYGSLPSAEGLVNRYLERLKFAFGGSPQLHPIYHVIRSPYCDPSQVESLELDSNLRLDRL
ncbi:hypothetical protein SAMN06265338_101315 [Rhodoblastus acidophilus]|uniref:Uncharacterized protein n=1 Tax=Rhodoblastus acidophilus TaxID=1074 RepID=A0A212Q0T1_RHOAC|nr:hypothetical protein [Rhodoblastus acidophilus]PPQ38788.1 hypothetical protein CKO16_09270 [Rhodoblastus acidophilus]RAI20442.1 hypothetical protein CH337_09500 [Rhodoblastus acidophilus]SNB52819.1 hypothetical protein SAMN06265338_101315 [Rhodoblastus acidophilus]